MRKARIILCALFALSCALASAQEISGIGGFDELSIDTTTVKRKFTVNNYAAIGVNVGTTFSRMMFNPTVSQTWMHNPFYASVMFTKHLSMFGFIPYFGYQVGIAYGHEGYKFKENKETGYMHNIEGAESAKFDVIEVPVMSYFHVDVSHFKVEAMAGPYVGYRRSVTRIGDNVVDTLRRNFASYDLRWEFGIEGGVGLALVFDPFEFHLNGLVRYSMSSIYTPDSSPSQYNQYYYRFAYPLDINITFGVYYQLTKRSGRTNSQLKQEARDIVIQEWKQAHEDSSNQDRR